MAFYDVLGKKIQQTGQGALDKTKKTAETVKLNSSISDLEKEITSIYTEMGRIYFQKHAGDAQKNEMYPYFQKIDEKMQQIQNCKNQIRALKGMSTCKVCGKDINVNAVFCNYCGARLVPEIVVPHTGDRCPNCGQPLEEDQLFCTECGHRIEKALIEDNEVQLKFKRICSNCGKELEEDAVYCAFCGHKNDVVDANGIHNVEIDVNKEDEINTRANVDMEESLEQKENNSEFYESRETSNAAGGKPESNEEDFEVITEEIVIEESLTEENDIGAEEEQLFCSNCGFKLNGDEMFCSECGFKLK